VRRKGINRKGHRAEPAFDLVMAYRYGDKLAGSQGVAQFVGFARAFPDGALWREHVAQVLEDELRAALASGDGRFFRELGTIIDKANEQLGPAALDTWICATLFSVVIDKEGKRTVQPHANKTAKELLALYMRSPMAKHYKPSPPAFYTKLREHSVAHKPARKGRPPKVKPKRKY
jgi:hypothetical protein